MSILKIREFTKRETILTTSRLRNLIFSRSRFSRGRDNSLKRDSRCANFAAFHARLAMHKFAAPYVQLTSRFSAIFHKSFATQEYISEGNTARQYR